ncbi:hypothetical protein BJ742DRAFT_812993 [Cladochytrium replicatum]|nr:hypothetical protein BJ742DRAFT_812993 [Cladochytrium replicatum]
MVLEIFAPSSIIKSVLQYHLILSSDHLHMSSRPCILNQTLAQPISNTQAPQPDGQIIAMVFQATRIPPIQHCDLVICTRNVDAASCCCCDPETAFSAAPRLQDSDVPKYTPLAIDYEIENNHADVLEWRKQTDLTLINSSDVNVACTEDHVHFLNWFKSSWATQPWSELRM